MYLLFSDSFSRYYFLEGGFIFKWEEGVCIFSVCVGLHTICHVGFIWKDLRLQVQQLFQLLSNMFLTIKFWNILILFSWL